MKFFLFNLKSMLSRFGFGIVLLALMGCAPSLQSETLAPYDYVNSHIDPESAAMEAFARANLMTIDGDFEGSLKAINQAIEIDPESAFLYMSKAEILLHLGRLEPAKIELLEALRLAPDMLDAYLILSEVQTVLGDHPAAIESLLSARRLQPEDQEVVLHLALAYTRNRDSTSAILLLENLIENFPENMNARLALARIYLVSNSPLLSSEAYRNLLKIDPQNEQATLELGTLYLQRSQPEQAAVLYTHYLVMVPDDSRIRYQLVRLYLDQNNLDAALEQLSLIVEYNPEDLGALHKIGLIQLQQKKPEQAEKVFRKVVSKNPDGASYYALGIALETGGKEEEAIAAFAQVDADSDLFPDAIIHRAYLLPKFKRSQEAISLLESQLSLLEPAPELYEFLAALYGKEKAWAQAKQTLSVGLEQFPDHPGLLLRQAFLLDLVGEFDTSLASAQKVIDLDPDNAEALNFIAYSYAVQNIRLEKAEELVLKAIELADAPHIRDTYGWILYRMNRLYEALVELKKAANAIPDDPTVLEHLGDVYVALGQFKEAHSAYTRGLDSGRISDPVGIQRKIDALQLDSLK